MNSIIYQQSQQPPRDILKIVFLFATLGVSTYVMYRISRSLAREITGDIS